MSPVLRFDAVTYRVRLSGRRRRQRQILPELSFELEAGRSLAVTGPSGVGKSTVVALAMGLIVPSSGTVVVDGHELSTLSTDRRAQVRGRSVGVVFQASELIEELTPLENVMLPAMLNPAAHLEGQDLGEHAQGLLQAVGLDLGDTPTDRLSGGERQRVAVARALVNSPTLVLADEPTGSLDMDNRDRIADLIFGLPASTRCAVLVVTHDADVAARADEHLNLAELGRPVVSAQQSGS